MRYVKLIILAAIFLAITAEPIWAIGIGGSAPAPHLGRGSMENYCLSQGGNPRDGNCYFPDGSYCTLKSFYEGTCPGREYYEQNMWMAEAYNFLYGDAGFYSPPYYSPYYSPNYAPSSVSGTPYYSSNYNYWPIYSNYWPFYTHGYGWL